MLRSEINDLEYILNDNTVLSQLFSPLNEELSKLRYSADVFRSLCMPTFCMLGFLRHLKGACSMRKYLQSLFHLTDNHVMPLARSTWFDALKSKRRHEVLLNVLPRLVNRAKKSLPDRLDKIPGLAGKPVYAVDGTYQQESARYQRCTPKQGGTDNHKGHCLLPFFDVRLGIAIDVRIETKSISETKMLKAYALEKPSLLQQRGALWLADRGFVDCPFWDSLKRARDIEVITRIKENMVIMSTVAQAVAPLLINEGIQSDELVHLKASAHVWRLVTYLSPAGNLFRYLTNNMDLEPGVIAFMYLRRWDEEKYFDTWKNDFAQRKAWSKDLVAIRSQTLMAIITSILVAIFVHDFQNKWNVADEKAFDKQEKRFNENITKPIKSEINCDTRPWYMLYYRSVSKISKQVLRFFEFCFVKKASEQLYERQLRPLFLKYL